MRVVLILGVLAIIGVGGWYTLSSSSPSARRAARRERLGPLPEIAERPTASPPSADTGGDPASKVPKALSPSRRPSRAANRAAPDAMRQAEDPPPRPPPPAPPEAPEVRRFRRQVVEYLGRINQTEGSEWAEQARQTLEAAFNADDAAGLGLDGVRCGEAECLLRVQFIAESELEDRLEAIWDHIENLELDEAVVDPDIPGQVILFVRKMDAAQRAH